jgi:hypothetical protein
MRNDLSPYMPHYRDSNVVPQNQITALQAMAACSAVEFKGAKATIVAANTARVFVLSQSQRATPLKGALKSWSRAQSPFHFFINFCGYFAH